MVFSYLWAMGSFLLLFNPVEMLSGLQSVSVSWSPFMSLFCDNDQPHYPFLKLFICSYYCVLYSASLPLQVEQIQVYQIHRPTVIQRVYIKLAFHQPSESLISSVAEIQSTQMNLLQDWISVIPSAKSVVNLGTLRERGPPNIV